MRHDGGRWHLLQIKLQTARQHGHWNFLRIGGGENKFDMFGRFFQRLQHRVESVVGQHVNFIDHVDLEARIRWRVHRLFQQLRHFIDTAIGRRVELDVIDKATCIDGCAGIANTTRL